MNGRQPYWNRKIREDRRIPGLAPTLTKQRGLKGSKLGPANQGRRLSSAEQLAVEKQLRREGKL